MGFEGEFAQYRSIRRLSIDSQVHDVLKRCNFAPVEKDGSIPAAKEHILDATSLKPDGPPPDLVLAIDGSHVEVPVKNGFPGAEVSYLTCSEVMFDMTKIREIESRRPVDPQQIQSVETAGSTDAVLPSTNVILEGCGDTRASFRQAFFELLSRETCNLGTATLLDTFEAIVGTPGQGSISCPYKGSHECDNLFTYQKGVYKCSCTHGGNLFSSDWLRIHEGVSDLSNGAVFGEAMQVIERLKIVHFLRYLEGEKRLSVLRRIGIIIDGPLAVFGHPAELKDKISDEIIRINNLASKFTRGVDLLMVGIEKSGAFVDHFDRLDIHPSGEPNRLPNNTVILLTDAYIKRNIAPTNSPKIYGRDTYFGRKFLYKNKRGYRIVASVPFLRDSDRDLKKAHFSQFPRLSSVLPLLDELCSTRYPNSVTPLISAHAEAAIPLNLGARVLKQIAEEYIPQ